ncbi:MAG: hypothetical protein ABSH12_03825 [Endomicrobiales bacterium]|jgi:hypothetical protein
MKIDLTCRDVELILAALYETTEKDMENPMNGGFTVNDLALIDKLEAALRRGDFFCEDTLLTPVSDLFH